MLEGSMWTIVLDRHPMNTLMEVGKRSAKKRIFEDNRDKMIDQYIKFAGLTTLPGTTWIANDIPKPKGAGNSYPIEMSMRRFFGSVFASGILQRRMIKEGLVSGFSQANEFLAMAFFQYLEMWRDKNN